MAFVLALVLGVGGAIRWGMSARRAGYAPAPAAASEATTAAPAVAVAPVSLSSSGSLGPAAPAEAAPAMSATMADALSLAGRGRFPEAVDLAGAVSPDLREASISSVFSLWAGTQPRPAAEAALALADDAQRGFAWQAVVAAWAESDPAALAAHALSLSDATARARALDAALPRWLERDERSAVDWVGALPSGRGSDQAVALLARHPAFFDRGADLALDWAEAIQDPVLRSRTLGVVVRAWLSTSPSEAARYARRSVDILPAEKEDILVGERFTAHP